MGDKAASPRRSRRWLLRAAGAGLVGLLGARLLLPRLWRNGSPRPLPPEAQDFVERCWQGIDRTRAWDVHVHAVGLPEGGNGCWVNPRWRQWWNLWNHLQYELYLGAAGLTADAGTDAAYVERLLALHRGSNAAGKLVLFAFDAFVREDGSEDLEHSTFVVPNDYVLRLAREHDAFVPCASVHPYRKDALLRLDAAAAGGARAVKWLPNAMGIDPASERCDEFYARLAELGLPLIAHAGEESAVEAAEYQQLGAPWRLERALDAGVRVCAAHCGSLGSTLDAEGVERDSLAQFQELARARPELFGDISAIAFANRAGPVLRQVLLAGDLHGRLVNGSDFPVAGIDPVISTRLLVMRDLMDGEDAELCELVWDANPLLFDFCVKRCVRAIDEDGGAHRFPASAFETARLFDA